MRLRDGCSAVSSVWCPGQGIAWRQIVEAIAVQLHGRRRTRYFGAVSAASDCKSDKQSRALSSVSTTDWRTPRTRSPVGRIAVAARQPKKLAHTAYLTSGLDNQNRGGCGKWGKVVVGSAPPSVAPPTTLPPDPPALRANCGGDSHTAVAATHLGRYLPIRVGRSRTSPGPCRHLRSERPSGAPTGRRWTEVLWLRDGGAGNRTQWASPL